MRVLQVVHGYPPHQLGGTEIHTRAVARALAARGHQVWVFAARPHDAAQPSRPEVIRDGPIVVTWIDGATDRLIDPGVRRRFERLMDDVAPDVVHVQHHLHLSGDLVEAAHLRSMPTVVSLHDPWFQCRLAWVGPRDRHPFPGRAWGVACAWHGILRRPRIAASLLRRGRLPGALLDTLVAPSVMRRQLASADALVAPSTFVIDTFVRFGVSRERFWGRRSFPYFDAKYELLCGDRRSARREFLGVLTGGDTMRRHRLASGVGLVAASSSPRLFSTLLAGRRHLRRSSRRHARSGGG